MDNSVPQHVKFPQKQCFKCKEFYPATNAYFFKDSHKKDGFYPTCKKCKDSKHFGVEHECREGEKQCSKCKKFLPTSAEYFYESTRSTQCKECHSERRKQYHAQNQEIMNTRKKQYRQENKQVVNARRRASYIFEREKRNAWQKWYHQTEQGKMMYRAKMHRRRAREMKVSESFTSQELQDQLKRQKHKCYYCKKKLGKGKGAWHADHIVPLSRENTSGSIDNIVITCPTCNLSKGSKLLHEWPDGGRLI